MDCFVINLNRSPDRLEQMREEFGRLQLKFTRVTAVDGNELTEIEYQNHAKLRQLSRPQVGVLLSHKKCWELFSESSSQYCAIFEDDIHLSDDLKIFLESLEEAQPHFEVLKIETARKKILIGRKNLFSVLSRNCQRIGSYHVGAAGYVLHRDFLTALSRFKKIADTIPVDEFLFEFLINFYDVLQVNPALVIQDQAEGVKNKTHTESLIANNTVIKRQNIIDKLVREIRRPFDKLVQDKFGLKLIAYKRQKIDFI